MIRKIIDYYKRNPQNILLQIVTLLFTFILVNMYINYSNTVEWEKYSGLTIAEQEPFMLYLSEEEKTQLKKYTYLENKVYDKTTNTFNDNLQENDILQLQDAYENLPKDLKNRVANTYNTIIDLWDSQRDFKKMLNEQGEIKTEVTPYSIAEYMKKHGDILSKYLESKTYNGVAVEMYKKLSLLITDANKISEVINALNKNYTLDGKSLMLNKDIVKEDFSKAIEQIEDLQYNWEIVDEVFYPAYINSEEYLEAHQKEKDKFDYLEKLKKDKESFEKWVEEFNNLKKDIVEYKDFTNKDKDVVEEWARENKIKVNYKYSNSGFISKDKVISQKPSKGDLSHIHKDTTVEVTVSKGGLYGE